MNLYMYPFCRHCVDDSTVCMSSGWATPITRTGPNQARAGVVSPANRRAISRRTAFFREIKINKSGKRARKKGTLTFVVLADEAMADAEHRQLCRPAHVRPHHAVDAPFVQFEQNADDQRQDAHGQQHRVDQHNATIRDLLRGIIVLLFSTK